MFNNVTVGKKIIMGFGLTIVFLCAIVGASYMGIGTIVNDASCVIDGNKLRSLITEKEVDHLAWAGEVSELLTNDSITVLNAQTDDHKCALGTWLFGDERKKAEALINDAEFSKLLLVLEKEHAQLHASAKDIKTVFKQADSQLPTFLCEKEIDHLKWVAKIQSLFSQNLKELDADVNHDYHGCGLGHFLYSAKTAKMARANSEFGSAIEQLKKPHADLHKSSISIRKKWKQTHPGLIATLQARLDDHRKWSASVCSSLLTNNEINVEENPAKCGFGVWLNGGECALLCEESSAFNDAITKVKTHHNALHASIAPIKAAQKNEVKKQLFKGTTEKELEEVASVFAGLIKHEQSIDRSAAEAKKQFLLKTLPALAQTQAALAKVKKQATRDLSGMAKANAIYATVTKPTLGKVRKTMEEIQERIDAAMMTDAVMLSSATKTNGIVVTAGVIAVVLALILAVIIAKGITGPLNMIVSTLSSSSEQVTSAAGQVSQSSQGLAEGANEQASSLEETSASLEELTSMTVQNTDNSNQAKSLAADAKKSADVGAEAMERMAGAIGEIKKSSDETVGIVKTIEEIAFQTNLLALNAAVEAARAGDAGKGFAVVAEEVRNLAQRSAEAAKNTSALITGSVENINNGVSITKEVSDALSQIAEGTEKVSQITLEIASAGNEQSKGIEQINTTVSQMNQVTQQNAASSEEGAAAAEELGAQASEVMRVVDELRTMVDGSKDAKVGPALAQHPTSSSQRMIAQNKPKSGVARPEDVIPMGDDDFKDF